MHDTKKIIIAGKKAKTSLEKVLKMLEDEKYCIDIIQQNLAVIGLLRSMNLSLLSGHLHCCVKDAAVAQDTKKLDTMMDELMMVVKVAQTK